ncbi:hypothetical protein QE382_000573 [Sphingobacterium zeae]|uniref:Uncharacterized protein n=2 Tax=Sphingobacterium zeae TaxID=1776859 RepID=A0ABU0U0X1_9SPHI|nr:MULTISPECIES: hypothetical protein [unclassified Sphingobacterium]MDQ1148589.1 hypothetical protein [Sphingobacterium zeae]
MCDTKILSQRGDTHISVCLKCQTYYIWQQSFVLTFTKNKFVDFLNMTRSTGDELFFSSFPDGEFRLIMKTPYPDIVFSFDEEQWQNFRDALQESYYMNEFYGMLNN